MFKDFILNEVEKIAVVVAGLVGFKVATKPDEFIKLADTTLQNEYGIKLLELTTSDFEVLLEKQNYHPDKLDALAALLYMYHEPFSPDPETITSLQKILIIFDHLEQKHHRSSFENINKRNSIYQFLQKNMSKDLTWKLLSSSYIHKGPWATLRIDKCQMPDGRIVDDYYVLEYSSWVNAVAITEHNKILLVKQYRHAAGIISLEIPGGVVDGEEKPVEALRRELLEETGYQFDDFELLCTVYGNPSTANNQTFTYLAKGGKKVQEQSLDDHEELIVEEYTIAEVKQLLLENKVVQAMHCAGLFYGMVKLGEL